MKDAKITGIIFLIIIVAYFSTSFYKTIPAGHVGVATLFGKVQMNPYPAGFHFPINPLYSWYVYDARQKTHSERADVPSQDQLTTQVDVSVQYRLIDSAAPTILRETGAIEDMVRVHLVPKLRSAVREQGKSLKKAEEFFFETTQKRLQDDLMAILKEYMLPKGMDIQSVLIRDIQLPKFINDAIQQKKEREQAAEKQKAELLRFKTEQEQIFVKAEAQRRAADEEAKMKRILAEAKAFEIQKINDAIASNPAYIQLQALEALKEISKDKNSKIYFLNGDSPMPLPLMHLGEEK